MAATEAASPNGPRYAREDPTLLKPWKALVDGSTGYLYYWNPETNVTQYERPSSSSSQSHSGPPPKSTSVPVSSSVQIHPSSQGQHRSSRNEDDGRRNGSSGNSVIKHATVNGGRNHQSVKVTNGHLDSAPNGFSVGAHGSSNSHNHVHHSSRSSARVYGSETAAGSAESYRLQHEITVSGDDVPPPLMSFESTGFPSEILREVRHAGFSAPTPIQAQSWPIALQSHDIVAIAKTGSGKTLGYLIPGFIHIKQQCKNPQLGPTVLVLSPTRELATQIQDEAVKFGRSSRISSTCVYGGTPKGPQLREIERGTDIVVATPGRLNDFLQMRKISLHQVSYLVLDEADRMLDMGFEPQIRKIVKQVPQRNRQTLMFTATWPKEVRKIAADLLVFPVQINIGSTDELVANKSITQYVEVVSPMEKNRRLEQILRSQEPGSKVIVFCSTKKMCEQLARTMPRQFGASAIHGDKSQGERDFVLNQFRSGRSPVLVATDVAARGLDIKDIRVVINYDFPTGIEDYVHRIGRTGRAGATGLAYTFFTEQDVKFAADLIKILEGANQHVPPQICAMASKRVGIDKSRRQGGFVPKGRDGIHARPNGSSYGGRGGHGPPTSPGRSDRGHGGRGHGREPHHDRNGRGNHDGHDKNSHDRYLMSYAADGDCLTRDRDHRPYRRSQSPDRGNGWGAYNQSRSRSRSRSLDRGIVVPKARRRSPSPRRNASPSAHRSLDVVRSPQPQLHRGSPYRRERSPLGGRPISPSVRRKNLMDSHDRGDHKKLLNGLLHSRHSEEDEEGLITAEDDAAIPQEEEGTILADD